MDLLERVTDRLVQVLTVLGAACVVAMMAMVMLDVTLRELVSWPIPGTNEMVSYYYMVGSVFLPLALVQRERGHVMIELFTLWMPPRGRSAMDAVVLVVCAIAMILFAHAGLEKAIMMTERDEYRVGLTDVAVWPSRWFVPFGCGAMALVMLLQAAREVMYAAGRSQAHQEAMHMEDAEQV